MRNLRLLRRFWATSLAADLEYQVNVLIELLAVGGNLAGSLFVLSLLFGQGGSLGGWSWEEALVVLGLYTLLDGITSTVLQPNLSTIVTHVREGTLDFVLLKPVDSQFWLSARTFSPWGLPGVAAGLALIVVAAAQAGARPDGASVVAALVLLLSSTLILYSLWFVLAATSYLVREGLERHRGAARRPGGRPLPGQRLSRGLAHVFHLCPAGGFPHNRAG